MKDSYSGSYAAAGVDITAGYKAVELMKQHIQRTNTPGVLSGIGGFGGLFELRKVDVGAHQRVGVARAEQRRQPFAIHVFLPLVLSMRKPWPRAPGARKRRPGISGRL